LSLSIPACKVALPRPTIVQEPAGGAMRIGGGRRRPSDDDRHDDDPTIDTLIDWQTDPFLDAILAMSARSDPGASASTAAVFTAPQLAALPAAADAVGTAAPRSLKGVELQVFDTRLAALYFSQSPIAMQTAELTTRAESSAIRTVAGRDYVLIDASADNGDGAALLAELVKIGLQGGSAFGNLASGFLPVDQVAALLEVAHLAHAAESRMLSNVGTVTTQADAAMRADDARTNFSVDGSGVTVGILSDSYDSLGGAATGVANGDLPAGVLVVDDFFHPDDTDEGRGMAELVHDLAPGAAIMFATAFTGQANFANNIIALANAGADIIVDDVFYFAEPMYQDGIIAQAVDQVVAAGVTYFSAAGNDGNNGFEAAYVDSGVDATWDGFHEDLAQLRETGADAHFLPVTVDPGRTAFVTLHWDQPSNSVSPGHGSANDLDLGVYDSTGTTLLTFSIDDNIGFDPFEIVELNNASDVPVTYNIAVGLFDGAAPAAMKLLVIGRAELGSSTLNINDGTIFGHPAAEGAIAVGAASYVDTPEFGVSPPLAEFFTSEGPNRIFYDTAGNRFAVPVTRLGPELTAVDGGNTSFFGRDDDDPDSFPNFFGTSAAAPDAAAVAALMLELNPFLTPAEILSILSSTAIDMGAAGFDELTGAGLIDALAALGATPLPEAVPHDFDRDFKSDILWRHESGPLASWELDSGTISHYHFLGGLDPSNRVDAIADFDGNRTAEVLWRNASGNITTWDIKHGAITDSHAVGPSNPADEIAGIGDFNGDGHDELLWRTAAIPDTDVAIDPGVPGVVTWQLNGDAVAFKRDYGPVTSDWTIVGTGDVNGDGNTDIFWRHDMGHLVSWEVDDGAIIGYNDHGHVGNEYHFAGTGDFNGDGKSGDVLWRHDAGQVVTWELDGGALIGYHDFGIVTNDYKIEEIGDYNGDFRSDILWRHDSGLPITWELDGGTIIGYHAFPGVDPIWQVQPV
jgi:Subtilase family